MGAWGTGIFDDDTAMDFLNELTDSGNPLQLMKNALKEAQDAEYVEYGKNLESLAGRLGL
jgi:hypothetical protein